jgi:hypothetical protein
MLGRFPGKVSSAAAGSEFPSLPTDSQLANSSRRCRRRETWHGTLAPRPALEHHQGEGSWRKMRSCRETSRREDKKEPTTIYIPTRRGSCSRSPLWRADASTTIILKPSTISSEACRS